MQISSCISYMWYLIKLAMTDALLPQATPDQSLYNYVRCLEIGFEGLKCFICLFC